MLECKAEQAVDQQWVSQQKITPPSAGPLFTHKKTPYRANTPKAFP
jgi:hypothetical protein